MMLRVMMEEMSKPSKPNSAGPEAPISNHSVNGVKSAPKSINKNNECSLKFGTWNVRKGLIKREIEITNLLSESDLDVLFLTETDVRIESENDFTIAGYKTFFHVRDKPEQKIRMMCLVKESALQMIRSFVKTLPF